MTLPFPDPREVEHRIDRLDQALDIAKIALTGCLMAMMVMVTYLTIQIAHDTNVSNQRHNENIRNQQILEQDLQRVAPPGVVLIPVPNEQH